MRIVVQNAKHIFEQVMHKTFHYRSKTKRYTVAIRIVSTLNNFFLLLLRCSVRTTYIVHTCYLILARKKNTSQVHPLSSDWEIENRMWCAFFILYCCSNYNTIRRLRSLSNDTIINECSNVEQKQHTHTHVYI